MFLSSEKIKEAVRLGELIITPYSDVKVKPASYTFTLDKAIKDLSTGEEISIPLEGFILKPGAFVIGINIF